MFFFLFSLCISDPIWFNKSQIFIQNVTQGSTLEFQVPLCRFMFYVFNNAGWSCVVSIHDANIKFAPPNQHGYNSNSYYPATIKFTFYENQEFWMQIMVNFTLKEKSIVATHPSDDWIDFLDVMTVWHPYHYLYSDDNQRRYELHYPNMVPDYFFISPISNIESHIISQSNYVKQISSSGVITVFPVCLRLKRPGRGLISIPLNQGIVCFLIKNHTFSTIDRHNTVIQITENEKLMIYHPFYGTTKNVINYLIIPHDTQCSSIHINRQDKRVVSIADKGSPWSEISANFNEEPNTCLFFASDEPQNIRLDYRTSQSDYFYLIRPEKRSTLSSTENSLVFPASTFMIVPRRSSPESHLAYFVLNDERFTFRGTSATINYSIGWTTLEQFTTIEEPDEIVVDSPFSSFSFSNSVNVFFMSAGSIFRLWNSTPNLPSGITATVYNPAGQQIKVLPQNDPSYVFSESTGYISISVKTTETIYHCFVLQNSSSVSNLPFKCNDFIVTSERQSYYSIANKLNPANATFKKGWNTCIYYKRVAGHQISITNPFTSQVKIDVYDNMMTKIDVSESIPQGSALLHIRVINPPRAGSIKIIDSCISMCKALHPATYVTTVSDDPSPGEMISLTDFVSSIATRRKIVLIVILSFGLFVVTFIAITSWVISCIINRRLRRRDEERLLRRNSFDFDADIRYPAPGSIPLAYGQPMQLVQPAAFQPVYPATYYLPVAY